MSLFSRFRPSARHNARRRLSSAPSAAEVLEVRRLLTNAAPSLANIVADNGEISADVIDDGSGGNISITLHYDIDGSNSPVYQSYEGASHVWQVGDKIPPNTTGTVTIVVTETPLSGGGGPVSTTHVVIAEGRQLASLDFDSIHGGPGMVEGVVGDAIDGVVGQVEVLYRELGELDWRFGDQTQPGDRFGFFVNDADGVRDYEVVVLNQYNGHEVYGQPVTLYDIPGLGVSGEGLLDEDEDGLFA